MTRLALVATLACGLAAAQPPRVSRASLEVVERALDNTVARFDINDPLDLLGTARGVYLAGYGAVFTLEVNLVITPMSPFYQPLTPPQIAKVREKKLARLALLKSALRQVMVSAASTLDNVPASEQIVIGVTLFYRSFEQREGLPSQFLMQTSRQMLMDFKANRISSQALDAAIHTQEL